MDEQPSCNECGSYNLKATTPPDEDGLCELRCEDCGHYQIDFAPQDT